LYAYIAITPVISTARRERLAFGAQNTQAYLAALHGSATLVFTRQQHARARACLSGEHYNTVAQYS